VKPGALEGVRLHNALADLDTRIGMERRIAVTCFLEGNEQEAQRHQATRRELQAQRHDLDRARAAWRLRCRLARRGIEAEP
jgi:hypothetical protein